MRHPILTALLFFAACTGGLASDAAYEAAEPAPTGPEWILAATEASGGTGNTFTHPASLGGAATTPRDALARMSEEGPPAYTARIHSCRKVRYSTLGNVLRSRGVNVDAMEELSAGDLYRTADQALGAPNYGARIPEVTELTVASASKIFDIFVQAAPEIIANMPTQEACMVGGVGAQMFNPDGTCREDGLSCLLGEPASLDHIEFCNYQVTRATTPEAGRNIVVAAILSATFTCE
jgi:hypothetical protein